MNKFCNLLKDLITQLVGGQLVLLLGNPVMKKIRSCSNVYVYKCDDVNIILQNIRY